MKRISILLLAAVCAMPGVLRAQDAAVQEQLDKLNARIEILTEAQKKQDDRIAGIEKELSVLQRQNSKPAEGGVTQEDLKQLAAKVEKARQDDNEHIIRELEKLQKKLAVNSSKPTPMADTPPLPSSGFEYVIQSGDTLSVIVAAYKEKNVKVTVDQILKANPGIKPDKLKVGQKIFIPAPAQ